MNTLAIVGGGSWGTALAAALAPRFRSIHLYFHEPELAVSAQVSRENGAFLPGIALAPNIRCTADLESAVARADLILGVMPSHAARSLYDRIHAAVRGRIPIVSATKGLDASTLQTMSQLIAGIFGSAYPVAVISGPSFAREVAEGKPSAIVCAGSDADLVAAIQERFSSEALRIYGSADPVGVELGGALKNVIAIAAGMCDGLVLGHNALAALITRGLAEITRLAAACGARPETLSGLAGLGDLVLTCTSDVSRNRQVGLKLASGASLDGILAATPMIAEGVRTAALAVQLAGRHNVDMPIAAEVHAVMNRLRTPREAIARLMTRTLRHEIVSAGPSGGGQAS